MVCDRCKLVIKTILHDLYLDPISVHLGEIDFGQLCLTTSQISDIKKKIEPLGFELLDDKKGQIIEKIKNIIIEFVHKGTEPVHIKFSEYLKKQVPYDYNYLSNLFSSTEGITIEQYLIHQKIEKAKEFIVYDELNFSEISYRLGYSSVAHLSTQFKKVTGLTPSKFRELKDVKRRNSLDNL